MITFVNRLKFLKKLLAVLMVAAFLFSAHAPIFAEVAEAKSNVFYYGNPDDPQLKRLVNEIKELLPKLFKMLFSLEWLKHPRQFYRALKRIIVVWYKLMVELATVLIGYIMQIDDEIATSSCANQACKKFHWSGKYWN